MEVEIQKVSSIKQGLKQEQEPALTAGKREDSAAGEELEEEEEGETRCVCGKIDPPDESGLYIQCEQCSVWQHGYCVGIAEGEDTRLEKYWCEQCKPELHHIYIEDSTGKTRSIYKPVQEKRRHSRRNNRHGKSSGTSTDPDAEEIDVKPAEIQQPPVSDGLINTASTPSTGDSNGGESASLARESRGNGGSPKDQTHFNGAASGSMNDRFGGDYPEDGDDIDLQLDDGKRLQDRKRATFSAREEKQYQLMLEKAIQESRRTSRQEDTDPAAQDRHGDSAYQSNQGTAAQEKELSAIRRNVTQLRPPDTSITGDPGPSHEDAQDMTGALNTSTVAGSSRVSMSPAPNKRSSQSRSQSSTSEDDAKRINGPRRSQRGPKIAKKGKKAPSSRSSIGRNKSNGNGAVSGRTDIGINKPMKPRLPPQRTTLSEMRRRVSAILEFISRTQWELSEEHSSKDDLVRFVENEQFIDQVDSIFEKYDEGFKLMDDLTRALLLWEKKYSNTTSANVNE